MKSKRNWDAFALLLIDVQQDFWKEEMSTQLAQYETCVGQLLANCRSEGIDIMHLRAQFSADKSDWMLRYRFGDTIPCIEGTPGAEVLDSATNSGDEPVLFKQTFDGFANPALETWLAANDKRFLLVAGLVTSVCVLLTSATAAQRGYLVAVVEDCCADQPAAHEHTLERYPFVFDRVTSNELVGRHAEWVALLQRATTATP